MGVGEICLVGLHLSHAVTGGFEHGVEGHSFYGGVGDGFDFEAAAESGLGHAIGAVAVDALPAIDFGAGALSEGDGGEEKKEERREDGAKIAKFHGWHPEGWRE